jgi:hypothetical protein
MNSSSIKNFSMKTEVVSPSASSTIPSVKKKRDPDNYIKAAKKNTWIKHVKKVGKKNNISYKEALQVCKSKKKSK